MLAKSEVLEQKSLLRHEGRPKRGPDDGEPEQHPPKLAKDENVNDIDGDAVFADHDWGRRNEPAWVSLVGETLGRLHRLPSEEMAHITSANARRLFRLPGSAEE